LSSSSLHNKRLLPAIFLHNLYELYSGGAISTIRLTGLLQNCGDTTQCYEWFKRFKDGRQSTDDDPRPGRPSTSTDAIHVAQVRAFVRSNRRLTVWEIAEECNISVVSCHTILTVKLEMHWVAAQDQRERRVAVCQELLDRANEDENFMNCIITGDETWFCGYDVETKAQSSQWVSKMSPTLEKARHVRSNVKAMLTVFLTLRELCIMSFCLKDKL
jgi:hypothetical protein